MGPAVFHLGNFCEAATFTITCEPLKTLPDEAASASALAPTWGHDYTLCGTCAAVLVLHGARIYARHSAHDAAWPFCCRLCVEMERESVEIVDIIVESTHWRGNYAQVI